MAQYTYDDSGVMAAAFAMTFLIFILVPTTYSLIPVSELLSRKQTPSCPCPECAEKTAREKKEERVVKFSPKPVLIALGWVIVAVLARHVMNNSGHIRIYNPFEILGLTEGTSEKDIKRHFKRLSIKFHPDKVKLQGNDTAETVAAKFVELTKAYKALTDETIRKNLEEYGHPDGRQETSMGIAIPPWMVEGKNTIWVLLAYALLLGGSLPYIVGRWWFGSRAYTKDGVHAKSAETFFKEIKEESKMEDVIKVLAHTWPHEKYSSQKIEGGKELESLEKDISAEITTPWLEKDDSPFVYRTKILIYAHLLRLPISSPFLQKEQRELLTHAPTLLNSLISIILSRNWLYVALHAMRLNAFLAQAIRPTVTQYNHILQYPGISQEDVAAFAAELPRWRYERSALPHLAKKLEAKGDGRAGILEKVGSRWGYLDVVDVSFKVIGEKIVTPGAYVNLVVKARIASPHAGKNVSHGTDGPAEEEAKDMDFMVSRKEFEDPVPGSQTFGYAHAPRWPTSKKPGWWIVLGDEKTGRIIVPPMKMTEVPYSDESLARNFKAWKVVFQAPNQIGVFTWKIWFVSDTFVDEEETVDIMLKLDDPALLETSDIQDDEISEPEEDTLAGQMAAMRGQKVKKALEDDDDTSGTDDDEGDSSSSSSSDSDSD